MPEVKMKVSEEELKDIQEFRKHHKLETDSEALRQMSGIKTYRLLKQKTDPKRKKKSFVARQELGIPGVYPCALQEILEKQGITYDDFINNALSDGLKLAEKALGGDKEAEAKLVKIAKETGIDSYPAQIIEVGDVSVAEQAARELASSPPKLPPRFKE